VQRGRDDQFDESDGALPRRALAGLALNRAAPGWDFGHVSLLESVEQFVRPMPASVRPELGKEFSERGQICVLG
jgi:hypothetical protein